MILGTEEYSGVTNSGTRYRMTATKYNSSRYTATIVIDAEAACEDREIDLIYDLEELGQYLADKRGVVTE